MDHNIHLGDRLNRQRGQNSKKTIKMFAFERRHFNRHLRYVEVERIFVLSADTPFISEEDVLNGVNFEFAPFELLLNSPVPTSQSYARLLRMNFEAALSHLRRRVDEERERVFNLVGTHQVATASGIVLNDHLLHMFVPPDRLHPDVMWERVLEPVGRVPVITPFTVEGNLINTSLPRVAAAKFQDSVSRVHSGAVLPHNFADPVFQRERVEQLVEKLATRREDYLRGGQLAVRGVFHVPAPSQLGKAGRPLRGTSLLNAVPDQPGTSHFVGSVSRVQHPEQTRSRHEQTQVVANVSVDPSPDRDLKRPAEEDLLEGTSNMYPKLRVCLVEGPSSVYEKRGPPPNSPASKASEDSIDVGEREDELAEAEDSSPNKN